MVDFDPAVGAEIQKTRPALVVQNDLANRYSPTTVVLPITSRGVRSVRLLSEVLIEAPEGGLYADSIVLVGKIRALDTIRLRKLLGRVAPKTMGEVENALALHLGFIWRI